MGGTRRTHRWRRESTSVGIVDAAVTHVARKPLRVATPRRDGASKSDSLANTSLAVTFNYGTRVPWYVK